MTNYRAVYKSDHLGVVDLEELIEQGKPLIFTIKHVKQEMGAIVAGNKGNFNIAYFEEPIKPLVLNATNAGTIRRLGKFGVDVDTWVNVTVELYIDANVKMKGQVVGGVRIKPILAVKQLPTLELNTPNFDNCRKAYLADNSVLDKIKAKYNVTENVLNELIKK